MSFDKNFLAKSDPIELEGFTVEEQINFLLAECNICVEQLPISAGSQPRLHLNEDGMRNILETIVQALFDFRLTLNNFEIRLKIQKAQKMPDGAYEFDSQILFSTTDGDKIINLKFGINPENILPYGVNIFSSQTAEA